MSEMIERVGLALVAVAPVPMSMFTADDVRVLARAAIKAMREPTEAMVEAAGATSACVPGDLDDSATFYPAVAWRAMIDAALEPTP